MEHLLNPLQLLVKLGIQHGLQALVLMVDLLVHIGQLGVEVLVLDLLIMVLLCCWPTVAVSCSSLDSSALTRESVASFISSSSGLSLAMIFSSNCSWSALIWPTDSSFGAVGIAMGFHGSWCSHGSSCGTGSVCFRCFIVCGEARIACLTPVLLVDLSSGAMRTSPCCKWKMQWLGSSAVWTLHMTPLRSCAWPTGLTGLACQFYFWKTCIRDCFVLPNDHGPTLNLRSSDPGRKTRSDRNVWCKASASALVTRIPYRSPYRTNVEFAWARWVSCASEYCFCMSHTTWQDSSGCLPSSERGS